MRKYRAIAWALITAILVNNLSGLGVLRVQASELSISENTISENIISDMEFETTEDAFTIPEFESVTAENPLIEIPDFSESPDMTSLAMPDTPTPYVITEAVGLYEILKIVLCALGIGITGVALSKVGAEFADYINGSSALAFNEEGTRQWRVIQGGKKPDDNGNPTDEVLTVAQVTLAMIAVVRQFLRLKNLSNETDEPVSQTYGSYHFVELTELDKYHSFGYILSATSNYSAYRHGLELLTSNASVFVTAFIAPLPSSGTPAVWFYVFSREPFSLKGETSKSSFNTFERAINFINTVPDKFTWYNSNAQYNSSYHVYSYNLGCSSGIDEFNLLQSVNIDGFSDGSVEGAANAFCNLMHIPVAHKPVFNLNDILGRPITAQQAHDISNSISNKIDTPIGNGQTVPDNFEQMLKDAVTDALTEAGVIGGSTTDPTPDPDPNPDKPPVIDISGILDGLGKILNAILNLPSRIGESVVNLAYSLFAPLIQLIPDAITEGWAQGIGEIKTALRALPDWLLEKLTGLPVKIIGPDGRPLELPIEWPSVFPWELPNIHIDWGETFPWELPEINLPEIPEINFPEIPNYFEILGTIHGAILGIADSLILDVPAIQTAVQEAIDSVKTDSGLEEIERIFHMFNFGSSYEYPKITVKTPEILKQFYNEDEIVLLDFGNYKQYCLMARNIFSITLYIGFLWWCLRHLKVQLHIG